MPSTTEPRRIQWPSLITIVAVAILVGTELLGAAWACGWALAGLFGLGATLGMALQGLMALGALALVVAFLRKAVSIEPVVR